MKMMERILRLDTVKSTNDVLKSLAEQGAKEGQIVIAEEQSAGKGRRGRSFSSPKGKGIYFSYLLRPEKLDASVSTLTPRAAVAVSRAIQKVSGMCPQIKWVNDLVIRGKKVCGILTEMAMEGGKIHHVILGIGINVNQEAEDFPEELAEIATSLSIEAGRTFSRERLIEELVKELDEMWRGMETTGGEYLEEYRRRCVTTGQDVCVISGSSRRKARAIQVNEDYSLQVEYEEGEREDLNSGEVSVRGVEGYV